jgi:hypothetical protein
MPKTRARRCGLKPDSCDPARRPESDPRNRASYHFDDTGGRLSASRRCPGAPPVPLFRGTGRRGKLSLFVRREAHAPLPPGRSFAAAVVFHVLVSEVVSEPTLASCTVLTGNSRNPLLGMALEPFVCSPARSETLSRLEVLQVKEASRIHLLTVSAPRQAADEHLGEPLRGSRRATCFQAGRLIAASRVLASYDAD